MRRLGKDSKKYGLVLMVGILWCCGAIIAHAQTLSSDFSDSKNQPGLSSVLYQLNQVQQSKGLTDARSFAQGHRLKLQDSQVQVVVELQEGYHPEQAAKDLGINFQKSHKNLLQATVNIQDLPRLARTPGVLYVRPPHRPVPLAVPSEGVSLIGADLWHTAGYTGAGVKVAILDLGFQGYQALLGTKLPNSNNVTVQSFSGDINGGGEVHGTACAEIVHDLVPNADMMYLVNFSTEVEFADAVTYLINEQVNVISFSVGWFCTAGPGDGTSEITQIVNNATSPSNGIFWAGSAGNQADRHWGGVFTDANANGYHEFASGVESNGVYLHAGNTLMVFLSWNDWLASAQDYDLELRDGLGNLVAQSDGPQTGSQPPIEELSYTAPATGWYYIKIKKYAATVNVTFRMDISINAAGNGNMQYVNSSNSIMLPADCFDCMTVGAAYWGDDSLEYFSSRGPTVDGRTKPDITAPDGVSTSTYGPGDFYGTSASAPHTAGAAALVKSNNLSYTNSQIKTYLTNNALSVGNLVPNNQFGWGLLNLLPPPPFTPTLPTITGLSINGGAPYTNNSTVLLTYTTTGFPTHYRISTGTGWSAWIPRVRASLSRSLGSTNGQREVFLQVKNNSGISAVAHAPIILDTIAPKGVVQINGGAATTTNNNVRLHLAMLDSNMTDAQMRISNTSFSATASTPSWESFTTVTTGKPWSLTAGTGYRTVYVQFKDGAGNVSPVYSSYIYVSTTNGTLWPSQTVFVTSPPALSIKNPYQPRNTSSTNLFLTLTYGVDLTSGIQARYYYSSSWTAWENVSGATITKNFYLPSTNGPRQVYVQVKDLSNGYVTDPQVASITIDTVAPGGTIQINNGAYSVSRAGNNTTLVTLTITASDITSGLDQMQMAINQTGLTPSSGNFVAFDPNVSNYPLNTPSTGYKYVFIWFKDKAGKISTRKYDAIYVIP